MHCLKQLPWVAFCQLHLSFHLVVCAPLSSSEVTINVTESQDSIFTACDIIDHTVALKPCLLLTLCLFLFSFPNHCQFLNLSFSSGRSPSYFLFQQAPHQSLFFTSYYSAHVFFLSDFLWLHQCISTTQVLHFSLRIPGFLLSLKHWSQDDLPEFFLWFYQPVFVSFPGIPLYCHFECKLGASMGIHL